MCTCKLMLKIMAKVGTLRVSGLHHTPSFGCSLSLCTEGCVRTVRLTCVGVRNVLREFTYIDCSYSTSRATLDRLVFFNA